jgi:hypothetical protein
MDLVIEGKTDIDLHESPVPEIAQHFGVHHGLTYHAVGSDDGSRRYALFDAMHTLTSSGASVEAEAYFIVATLLRADDGSYRVTEQDAFRGRLQALGWVQHRFDDDREA